MIVVQMVVEVSLCLLSQTLAQARIIHQTTHRLCQCLGITRRHQQSVLLLHHILTLSTIVCHHHGTSLRHILLWRQRTTLLHRRCQDTEVGSGHIRQHGMYKPCKHHLFGDALFLHHLLQMGSIFLAATTYQHQPEIPLLDLCYRLQQCIESLLRIQASMEHADVLYGVTMQEKGISTVLTLDLEEARKTIED